MSIEAAIETLRSSQVKEAYEAIDEPGRIKAFVRESDEKGLQHIAWFKGTVNLPELEQIAAIEDIGEYTWIGIHSLQITVFVVSSAELAAKVAATKFGGQVIEDTE